MSDVIAVGPHPDDIELAAGGTVAMLTASGLTVTLIDLTRGERATRGTPESRARESAAAAGLLGAASRECLELPDGEVAADNQDHRRRLVEAIRRHRPRLLLGMHWNDDHPDHIEGGALIRRAVYLAGLLHYPGPGPSEPVRVPRVLFAMGRRPFRPSLVVDVTTHYARKRKALDAYASQFRRVADDPLVTRISDPDFLPMVEARDRTYGSRIGAVFGEPFFEIGPVRVDRAEVLCPEAP